MMITYLTSPRYHLHVSAALNLRFKLGCGATARRAKLDQIQGGLQRASQDRQRGVAMIFFIFYSLKISLVRVFTLSD